MEYVDGEDLKTLLSRIGRLPTDKGNEIAQQLCSGISAAHQRGVLHRDLKPANIMIDGQGQVRITDFGLATIAEDSEDIAGMSGTPAYMAPEQLLRGKTNVKTDIYSLGLVLFELFTGTQVHVADSLAELRRRHEDSSTSRTDPGEIVEEMDTSTRRGIERCLSADPDDRPSSVDELAMWLPGGDPIAAALAAGETPTPDMVAAAGGDKRLPLWAVYTMTAAILVGIAILFAVSGPALYLDRFDDVLDPSTLRNRSKDVLADLGYDVDVVDSASQLVTPARSEVLRSEFDNHHYGYFDGAYFWYRASPEVLHAKDVEQWGQILETEPSWTPCMAGVRLDIAGRLRWFRRVPSVEVADNNRSDEVDCWDLFDEELIGFDLQTLEQVERQRNPPDAFDSARAWQGTVEGLGDVTVTAAQMNGKPTWFEVSRVADEGSLTDGNAINTRLAVTDAITSFSVTFVFFVFAYWHAVSGRGDMRSAGTFGCIILALTFASWVFNAHHTLSRFESELYWDGVANAAKNGLIGFCGYLAAEPLVRRTWPGMLTTWTRLTRGDIGNSRIAEDVLAGIVLGVIVVVNIYTLLGIFGVSRGSEAFHGNYQGGRFLIGGLFDAYQRAIVVGMSSVVTLSVARVIFRSKVVSCLLFAIVFTPFLGAIDGLPTSIWWLRATIPLIACAYLAIRHGLVGIIALQATIFTLFLPVTSKVDAYYFQHGLVGVGIVLAATAWALRGALRNRATGHRTLGTRR